MKTTKELCEELIKQLPDYQYAKTFKRHLRDLNTLDPTQYRFNQKLADLYITILQTFKHSKGEKANTTIMLEDWQKASIGIAFGWEFKNTKGKWVRRFNTVLFYMARKQGKSLLSAALALTDSLIRYQEGFEVATIATKSEQALLVWNEMYGMITKHPDLKSEFHKVGNTLHSKSDKAAKIYNLGRDSKSLDGLNLSIIVADEVHAHPDSSLMDVCKSSQGAREEPLLLMISTAGFSQASPLIPELEHSRAILNDTLKDEHYFAFLAEPNPKDERYSIETLRKSNPNIDVSVSEEFLLKQLKDAQQRPDLRVNYLTKYLNIFVSSSEEFISLQDWQESTTETPPPMENIKAVLVGCDLSIADDLTAIVTAFVDYDDNLYIESEFYLPEERIESLSKSYRAPLQEWIKAGYLKTTTGNSIDYEVIYELLKAKTQDYRFNNIEIYYDAYKFKSIKSSLENKDGFKDAYPVNQGFLTLSEPLSLMANYIRNHRIQHKQNAVMNWCMSNLTVKRDNYGNIKIDKSHPTQKIDGAAALGNIFFGLLPKTKEEDGADFGFI